MWQEGLSVTVDVEIRADKQDCMVQKGAGALAQRIIDV